MKRTITTFYALLILTLLPLWLQAASPGGIINRLQFKQLSTRNGLPNDEVQKVFQDKEGFMWFATRYGLCKYDGYDVTFFKSNLYTPDLFTNNNITCLTEDNNHNIWIGTQDGLNILNKKTGVIQKKRDENLNGNIACLLTANDGNLWIGADNGLYKYVPQNDSLILCGGENTDNIITSVTVKALMQDSEGDIWIGTWNQGLYRYHTETKTFYHYPQLNERNSVHALCEDSSGNIWVGGWAQGLIKLNNPKDMERVSWKHYLHEPQNPSSLADNLVYDICEDLNTQTIWVGTRSGLSILQPDEDLFINYKSSGSPYYISCNEINSITRDRANNLWLGSIGGGVFFVDTRQPKFKLYQFDNDENIPTSAVRTIMVDRDENVWLGIGTYGLALHNRRDNSFHHYSGIPEFAHSEKMPTVYAIMQRRKSNDIWIGTYDGGLYIYRKGEPVKHFTSDNTDYIKHLCVTALFEDSKGNCWVGTRYGLGVKRADDTGYLFDNSHLANVAIKDICEDQQGNIWVATGNNGIVKITGNISFPQALTYRKYAPDTKTLDTNVVLSIHSDSRGQLWAGTESHGLYLYNPEANTFVEQNRKYNLPADIVGSIEEDSEGNIWLGTNAGLIRVNQVNSRAPIRVYTTADGLQDNFFIPHSSYTKEGELFFGGYKGYNSFHPKELMDESPEIMFTVTDIKIFNHSFASLDKGLQQQISASTPAFTQSIRLPYQYNNISIEFASLTYKNPELNKYAYKLEGFDKEWQYTDASRHFAYYNNLSSGTYMFQLKATNENGVWSDQVKKVTVIVLPPFWATWWAFLVYLVVAIVITYFVYKIVKNRIILTNRIRLQELEKDQVEQMNHAKLQFFTNITHELLTPLTIISATIDELKMQAPQFEQIYTTITTNMQRLIRLLQQILEFRKAESGNLKLRVSPGDVVAFIHHKVEAFQPLIKKRKLHFSILCDPETIQGYFDTDKLDKILYNLLSNAAKYNREGGYIQLNVGYADSKDFILLSVRDNGKGMSEEAQKTLFTRFYEGDHRRYNTIGTGIGLSLTRDLVSLHGGEIWVESELGQGTTFFVKLPIDRSYFKKEEIDEEAVSVNKTISGIGGVQPVKPKFKPEEKKDYTVLVLEDNEELLQVMINLLSREYKVLSATNGKEGIDVLENENVDIIVSDVMMPEMDGIDFTRYAKDKLEFSHIPIILLTAKNTEKDRAEAYEAGADGYISKPFSLAVLHARIRNLLKSKEHMAHDFKNQLVFEVNALNYTSIDEAFIQEAVACVHRHLNDPSFDQPQFVEEMGTSRSTLYKKLKSLTGLNTSAFIKNVRLKAAVKIMEEKKNIRVSELAFAVGFNDPKYFSASFKKEFNMSPSDYMEGYISDFPEENS